MVDRPFSFWLLSSSSKTGPYSNVCRGQGSSGFFLYGYKLWPILISTGSIYVGQVSIFLVVLGPTFGCDLLPIVLGRRLDMSLQSVSTVEFLYGRLFAILLGSGV